MKSSAGVEIEEVLGGGVAARAGLRPGDRLIAVNGHEIRDVIDLMFYCNEPRLTMLIERGDKRRIGVLEGSGEGIGDIGIALKHFKVKTCRNKCLFCFVSQLPRGLRKSLYIKDEDYRMSFLYGSYITLTNLSEGDKKRIVEQRLSPLYVSVHSTERETRNSLLGNPQAQDVIKEIKFLTDNKIRIHTQVVLCPGYNDGNLAKTISDLYRFYPYVMSIAIVPVGLTAHRRRVMKPVGKEEALDALGVIQRFQVRFKKKHGDPIVYASDELYIKAGTAFPSLEQYGDLPQIENGVGLIPLFLHDAEGLGISPLTGTRRFVTFTGVSFYPYLMHFVDRLRQRGLTIEVAAVENAFFGRSVTVAGLLTGRDVLKSLAGIVQKGDVVLVPDVVMREGDEVFLDDVSRQDIESALGTEAVIIESSPKGLLKAVKELS